jgi:arylsulfatase A-like enzyme
VTADHGEEFWEHGGTGHGYTLYDENLRVPLIVWHSAAEPARVAAQVRLLDVAPTVAALLGVAADDAWQGESLVPMFGGAGIDRSLPAFAEHAHVPAKAARSPHEKLIVLLKGPTEELYRLDEDPGETRNVLEAGDGARAAGLRDAMRRWAQANYALARFRDAGEGAELSDMTIAQLRELGYIGGGPTGGPADPDLELWLALLDKL